MLPYYVLEEVWPSMCGLAITQLAHEPYKMLLSQNDLWQYNITSHAQHKDQHTLCGDLTLRTSRSCLTRSLPPSASETAK